jgi:hypothetical protein
MIDVRTSVCVMCVVFRDPPQKADELGLYNCQ